MKKIIELILIVPCLFILILIFFVIFIGAKESKTFETEADENVYGV